MRMPRFRIRTLMIAVAVAAGLTGVGVEGWRLYRFAKHCEQVSAGQAAKESQALNLMKARQRMLDSIDATAKGLESNLRAQGPVPWQMSEEFRMMVESPRVYYTAQRDYYSALARHHGQLREKYRKAASRPWLPVAPDPLEPPTPPEPE